MNNNPMDAFPYLQQMTQQFRQMFGDDFVKNLMSSMQMPMWNGASGMGNAGPMGGNGGPGQPNGRFGTQNQSQAESGSPQGQQTNPPGSDNQWPNWMGQWNPLAGGMPSEQGPSSGTSMFPPTDMYETRHELVLLLELPGLERASDVRLSVLPDRVIVKGDRKRTIGPSSFGTVVATERIVGAFERTILLPSRVRKQHAKASYAQGLLEIRLLKEGRATDGDANFIDVDFL